MINGPGLIFQSLNVDDSLCNQSSNLAITPKLFFRPPLKYQVQRHTTALKKLTVYSKCTDKIRTFSR